MVGFNYSYDKLHLDYDQFSVLQLPLAYLYQVNTSNIATYP